ncbi:MAG: 3-isopropylmalate dehydratase small subunit [Rhodospirillales bacterium]|nr:3-isopropylmalate dehydratase small subunit [Rhodospirillales bacterium]
MQTFTTLTGTAAPLPRINVDTDQIIPKQFLKTIARTGLAKGLFFDLRWDEKGKEIADFVLNKPAYRKASILIADENFGCGSSREHAPWALLDFGIRCVIAPSFADIFYNNCLKNGLLPLRLPKAEVEKLMQESTENPSANAKVTVDLERQRITAADGRTIAFDIDSFAKKCLMEGLDDIGLTLQKDSKIAAFEAAQKPRQPWLYR